MPISKKFLHIGHGPESDFNPDFPYALGFAYALGIGALLVKLVMDRMAYITDIVITPKEIERVKATSDEAWRLDYQPTVMGLIERTLYMSALTYGRGEFIAVWLGLKVAGGWQRWQEPKSGRYLYSRSLFGSGLSVLYALAGFLIVKGFSPKRNDLFSYAILVPSALILATLLLWWWLKRYIGKRE